jgi:hypothetical protein
MRGKGRAYLALRARRGFSGRRTEKRSKRLKPLGAALSSTSVMYRDGAGGSMSTTAADDLHTPPPATPHERRSDTRG